MRKKKLGFIQNGIKVGISPGKGKGVFATKKILKEELIESAPLLVIPEKQWPFVSSTVLADYFFETEEEHAAIALGYASLYNHSFDPNADYIVADDKIILTAIEDINIGDEITIDYGWEPFHYYDNKIISKEEFERSLEEKEEAND